MADRPTDEARLVQLAQAGDLTAFNDLVVRYQDYAYAVAIGLLADFELARDVVQESFIGAYTSLGKLKDPARFGGWLRGIVRHTAFRAVRELKRVRALAAEMGAEMALHSPAPSPEHRVRERERHEVVRQALTRLNPAQREVVSLFYTEDLSYRDIAGFLGVTETSVQGRLQRARARLREEIRMIEDREMKMVEDTFEHERLPDGFAAELRRLLDAAAARGRERTLAIERLAELGAGAVEPLCEALGDPRGPVRYAAAAALCKMKDARALRPVLRLLYADDWCLHDLFRKGQILAIPGVREALLKFVREGETEKRYMAVFALSQLRNDDEVYQCLLDTFRDRRGCDLDTRRNALRALCRLKPQEAPELLTEAFKERRLRRKSSWSWWQCLRSGRLLPIDVCIGGFGRDVPALGRLCAGEFVLRHGVAGKAVLEQLLETGRADQRASAALALARFEHSGAFELLMAELTSMIGSPKWVRLITRILVRHYPAQLKAWALEKGDDLVRFPAAACAAARVPLGKDDEALSALLVSAPPAAHAAAVSSLVKQRGAESAEHLRGCLRAGRPGKVARRAFKEMLRLGAPALPTVREMLVAPDWTERKAAVGLLRRWRVLAPEQRTAATKDPHVAVRHAATGNRLGA